MWAHNSLGPSVEPVVSKSETGRAMLSSWSVSKLESGTRETMFEIGRKMSDSSWIFL